MKIARHCRITFSLVFFISKFLTVRNLFVTAMFIIFLGIVPILAILFCCWYFCRDRRQREQLWAKIQGAPKLSLPCVLSTCSSVLSSFISFFVGPFSRLTLWLKRMKQRPVHQCVDQSAASTSAVAEKSKNTMDANDIFVISSVQRVGSRPKKLVFTSALPGVKVVSNLACSSNGTGQTLQDPAEHSPIVTTARNLPTFSKRADECLQNSDDRNRGTEQSKKQKSKTKKVEITEEVISVQLIPKPMKGKTRSFGVASDRLITEMIEITPLASPEVQRKIRTPSPTPSRLEKTRGDESPSSFSDGEMKKRDFGVWIKEKVNLKLPLRRNYGGASSDDSLLSTPSTRPGTAESVLSDSPMSFPIGGARSCQPSPLPKLLFHPPAQSHPLVFLSPSSSTRPLALPPPPPLVSSVAPKNIIRPAPLPPRFPPQPPRLPPPPPPPSSTKPRLI